MTHFTYREQSSELTERVDHAEVPPGRAEDVHQRGLGRRAEQGLCGRHEEESLRGEGRRGKDLLHELEAVRGRRRTEGVSRRPQTEGGEVVEVQDPSGVDVDDVEELADESGEVLDLLLVPSPVMGTTDNPGP